MKILIINDLLQGGGVEKLMYDLVMAFHDKYEITLFTDKKDDDFHKLYPKNVQYMYMHEVYYPEGKTKFERRLKANQRIKKEKEIKKRIWNMHFDVVLSMKEGWIMQRAISCGANIPLKYAWIHTDYKQSYFTKSIFQTAENEKNCMAQFDHIICVSNVIRDSIIEVIGDPGNLKVYYNPVNTEEIIEKSKTPVIDIKKRERFLFVSVGRLNIQKGYDILLEVCNLLNAQNYQFDVWIVGGGESWNQYEVLHDLEHKIHCYGLHNVFLIGHRENPYPYMKAGDVFLSTSRYEGYSYVSQEAGIIQKPLLLTDCSGVRELSDEIGGVKIMQNSVRGIYEGMIEAMESPAFIEDCLRGRKELDASMFWEKRLQQIEQLLQNNK